MRRILIGMLTAAAVVAAQDSLAIKVSVGLVNVAFTARDEHGKLQYASETEAPKVGEKLRLVPGHCDPTVDKFDWYVGIRRGRVECLWPVAARGGVS